MSGLLITCALYMQETCRGPVCSVEVTPAPLVSATAQESYKFQSSIWTLRVPSCTLCICGVHTGMQVQCEGMTKRTCPGSAAPDAHQDFKLEQHDHLHICPVTHSSNVLSVDSIHSLVVVTESESNARDLLKPTSATIA